MWSQGVDGRSGVVPTIGGGTVPLPWAAVNCGTGCVVGRSGEAARGGGSVSTRDSACVGCKRSGGSFDVDGCRSPNGSLNGSGLVYCAGRTLGSIRVMFQPGRG